MKFLMLLLSVVTMAANAFAYDYRCSTRREEGPARAICRGITIPVDRTRNFSDQRLECTSSSDNYVRRPQKFDFDTWATRNSSSDHQLRKEAFALRRALPMIQWDGTIPYETVEKWSWQACELHQNGFECGTHQECHTETDRVCDKDKDGNDTNCHDESRQVCEDVANTCWYDVTYNEAVHCSDEKMNYSAHFEKPGSDWSIDNPQVEKIASILPNKYDLLPGEVENIETYNNSGSSTTLNPSAAVVNNWNKYSISYGGSAVGAACRQDTTYDLSVAITTEGRKMGKKGPNAFRLPVDMEGKPVDVFGDQWAIDIKTGKKLHPTKLLLADSSAAMTQSISEVSRKATAREVKKIALGKEGNNGSRLGDPSDSLSKSFMKNTVVKIQLYKLNKMWFDKHASYFDVYTDDMKSTRASSNVYSDDQDIANADNYVFDLDSATNMRENIYKRVFDGLQPNRVYEIRVSMYQKGVPFYDQSCKDDHSGWKCFGYLGGWGATPFNTEGDYFSDPINIRFETPKVETRSIFQRMNTFMNPDTLGPIGWLAEKIGHERTTGANP